MPDNTIGEAYLQIKPSMEGISSEISAAMSDAGTESSGSFGSAFSSGLKKAGAVALSATAAAVAGVSALTKSAVSGYAEYEQLIGGVETLFGDSADIVSANAEAAFATAGMSANDYMETVTSFSASLLQSLGGDTEAAAGVADMAIRDMADNANKMGTSMESIQNAYQGFAKQNYTMLDNLKLGYGGTKTEMERLLADASELSGMEYSIDSLSDVYEAINVIQQSLGITGTTALEADETISGSAASIGAAWQNLVAGFANPDADLGDLISKLVSTASTALGNMMPAIEQALVGIGDAVLQLTPIIVERLPELLATLLPVVLEAAMSLVNSLAAALPDIAAVLIAQVPLIMDNIVNTIITLLPLLIETGLDVILALADGLVQSLPELIPALVATVLTIVEKLTDPDTILKLVDAALQIMIAIAEGLIKALPQLVMKAPVIIANLVAAIIQALPKLFEAAGELIKTIVTGIVNGFGEIFKLGAELVESVKDGFMEKVESAKNWGKDLIKNFIGGITQKWDDLKDTVSGVAGKVKDFLGFSEPKEGPLSNFHTYAPDMIDLFAEGIRNNVGTIEDAMSLLTGDIGSEMALNARVVGNVPERTLATQTASETTASQAAGVGAITIPIYLGDELLDTVLVSANQRINLMSGGVA